MKHVYLITMLMAMATMLGAAPLVWAGAEGGAPTDLASATGPEVWGTAVVRCDPGVTNYVTLRVKRVKDCNVQTQALLPVAGELAPGCIDNPNLFLYVELAAGSIFAADDDIDPAWVPIITKIKNYKVDEFTDVFHDDQLNVDIARTATISFDAQIKFLHR